MSSLHASAIPMPAVRHLQQRLLKGSPCADMTPQRLLWYFVIVNLSCIVLFWLVRIPTTDDEHYATTTGDPIQDRVGTSLYLSVMTQTTVGTSDIVPRSGVARVLQALQAAAAIGSILVVVLLAAACSRGAVLNSRV